MGELDVITNPPDTAAGYSSPDQVVLEAKVVGDAYPSIRIKAGGAIEIGDGSGPPEGFTEGVTYSDLDPILVDDEIADKRLPGDALIAVEANGTSYTVTVAQLAGWAMADNGRLVTTSTTLTPTDTALLVNSPTDVTVTLCSLTEEQAVGHPPVSILQLGAGAVTVINGTNATVNTTGTGRTKTRAAFSQIFAKPYTNFGAITFWTVYGDTANV